MTENGRAVSPVVFNEIDEHDFFPGGRSLVHHSEKAYWIVAAVLAASLFNQARRDALQSEVAGAFVHVLGDDGSAIERERLHICCASTP